MISEGPRDSEWSNDAENSALRNRNKTELQTKSNIAKVQTLNALQCII